MNKYVSLKMFLIIPFFTLLSMSDTPLQDGLIKRFTGNGMKNTTPFIVKDGWTVDWSASGSIFQIYLHNSNGDLVDVVANQQGPGGGSSFVAKGGKYYLSVNSVGGWNISVKNKTVQKELLTASNSLNFRGSGGKSTKPFKTTSGWNIAWSSSGEIFQIYIYNAQGDLVEVAANQMGSGSGSTYYPKSGTYYLTVNTTGSWSIKVSKAN